ncbi:MAG: six-hairpin glycosidase [Bacteroidales bacterium]|nr:six-hairpin glycosidase [Bacteroidales bacterium]
MKAFNQFSAVCLLFFATSGTSGNAQDYVHYTGKTLSNVDYHHGQLTPVVGTHNIQTMRANRQYPENSDGFGWTYNHASMLAYWNNTFYLQYLSNEVGEHVSPGQVFLQTSQDGYHWTKPQVLFPPYDVPEGYSKNGAGVPAQNMKAVPHQRVGFFTSSTGRLLTMAYYGVSLEDLSSPNDGNGIGRVIREIHKDGSFGPIYFIRYNRNFSEKNTDFPFYTRSRDRAFVAACNELLASPLYMMQWAEEADRDDPLIPLKKDYRAFSYYHLNDGRVVGLWKHALTSISTDKGKTWAEAIRAPGFVNGNAKIWGQKLSDGKFATVYNPSEFRWPLAISLSNDGLEYNSLWLVHGDITQLRYKGDEKSRGPQYVRGILENNGTPPDDNLWVTYSMNKEDIWVAKVPVPVIHKALEHADDVFDRMQEGNELERWNVYSPLWSPVTIENHEGKRWLTLKDSDPFDYAKAEKIIPESKDLNVSFAVKPMQNDHGNLQIEFQNAQGLPCTRLIFDSDGTLKLKYNYKYINLLNYVAGQVYTFNIHLSVGTRSLTVEVNGIKTTRLFFAPIESIERVVFRTGDIPEIPVANTPYTPDVDLPNADERDPEAIYYISHLKTEPPVATATILNADHYQHHVDYFNGMEDENVVNAIPNAVSWDWMKANIPLFECPQANFEQMYYYRWWSLRKHIKETPIGFVMTEFIIPRSHGDQYNMISCALGHHIYESRWLHNSEYINQNVRAWFRGNEGKPMAKLRAFSSWTADALYNKYKVDANKDFLLDMYPDLLQEFSAWDDRLQPSGLYEQEDVRDGMEESISGQRRVRFARPTINSYMYGNALALSEIARLNNDAAAIRKYTDYASNLKSLIQGRLWNENSHFFEALNPAGEHVLAREAIGYIPWYFNLPDDAENYGMAWNQIYDSTGFLAPYGMTTAERRHPKFRAHPCCNCEWDGAIWPFATAQAMTGFANLLNNYKHHTVNNDIYFRHLELYVESQYHRGRPYIGEYQDEVTGYWLKGDQERSRYYNHSTFNDLIITGLMGLRPRADDILEINPLVPQDKWDWFCLDNVPYHGKIITIVWDKTGDKYKRGKGFYVLIDGKLAAKSDQLQRLTCPLN